MKNGNNNEFFVEGGITSITNVTVNGTIATRHAYYGAWHVDSPHLAPRDAEPHRQGRPPAHRHAEQRHHEPGHRVPVPAVSVALASP